MFCPSCTDEYRAGIKKCPECGNDLVPELPEERWKLGPELVEVYRAGGHIQGEMVRSMLRGSGIESMLTGEGEAWGQVYKLTVGPMADVRVWVTQEDADRAKVLIGEALDVPPSDSLARSVPDLEAWAEGPPRGFFSSFVTNPFVRAATVLVTILLVLFLIWTATG